MSSNKSRAQVFAHLRQRIEQLQRETKGEPNYLEIIGQLEMVKVELNKAEALYHDRNYDETAKQVIVHNLTPIGDPIPYITRKK